MRNQILCKWILTGLIVLKGSSFALIWAQTAQNSLDSLKAIINQNQRDTAHISALSVAFKMVISNDTGLAYQYATQLKNIGDEFHQPKTEAEGITFLGKIRERQGNYEASKKCYEDALEIYLQLQDSSGIANSYGNLGNIFNYTGKFEEAIKFYQQAIEIQLKRNELKGVATNYNNIGVVYFYLQNYSKAEEYWLLTLETFRKIDNKMGMAYCLNNLGMIFSNKLNDYEIANSYYYEALEILRELNDTKGMGTAYNNIGETHYQRQEYKEALYAYKEALELKRTIGDRRGEALTLNNIGKINLDLGKHFEAIAFYKKALQISVDINNLDEEKGCYENLSEAYKLVGDYKNALGYHEKYSALKDSIWDKENTDAINKLETEFQVKQNKRENQLLQKENDLMAKKQELIESRDTAIIVSSVIGFLFLSGTLIFVYSSLRQKRKSNALLLDKNEIIERKNKDITDSINYAKRIQEALLPHPSLIEAFSNRMFVFYKPKDIVSGDFYWMKRLESELLFSVVDCTGHGVPGAFMSIIGSNGLNKAVNENGLIVPSEILNYLDRYVVETLNESSRGDSIKDGMDLSLIRLNLTNYELQFAGAYNPLYLVGKNATSRFPEFGALQENDTNGVEVKGMKQPIGFTVKEKREFTGHSMKLQKGDMIYIFSDGYADQFGGEKGNKFMTRRLKELVLSISDLPLEQQKQRVYQTITDWMGDYPQLDDMCLIGFRV